MLRSSFLDSRSQLWFRRRAHRTSRAVPQRSPRTWRSRSPICAASAALDAARPERRGYRTAFGRHSPLMKHLRFVTAASPWSVSGASVYANALPDFSGGDVFEYRGEHALKGLKRREKLALVGVSCLAQ